MIKKLHISPGTSKFWGNGKLSFKPSVTPQFGWSQPPFTQKSTSADETQNKGKTQS